MAFEDKTLTCVQCNAEFVFSAGEQRFYEERGLGSFPKRCKDCRRANKQRSRKGSEGGEYRSPAFENSAPAHQKIRGKGRGRQGPGGHRARQAGDYRAPAFRDKEIDPAGEYRAPGFKEYDGFNPEEEYRAPGFKEYEGINPNDEYRAPGFSEYEAAWKDERPMFTLICSSCGEKSLVPFLPEEKENPMCRECYAKHREQQRLERAKAAEDAAEEAEEALPDQNSTSSDA